MSDVTGYEVRVGTDDDGGIRGCALYLNAEQLAALGIESAEMVRYAVEEGELVVERSN